MTASHWCDIVVDATPEPTGNVGHVDRRPMFGDDTSPEQTPTPSEPESVGFVTRRNFLGLGASATGGLVLLSGVGEAHAARTIGAIGKHVRSVSAPALTQKQMATLKAVLARLLPSDDLGPGAVEAGVATYIDRSLGDCYAPLLPVYQSLLPLIEKSAASMGAPSFSALAQSKQIALLTAFEEGKASGLSRSSASSVAKDFQLLLAHMREGMFGDPMYGGNRHLAGWELIGYPGIKLVVPAKDQAVGTKVKPTGKTAKTYGGSPYNGSYVDA
jgi:gluconate 2-dehydrogenase gamma chain